MTLDDLLRHPDPAEAIAAALTAGEAPRALAALAAAAGLSTSAVRLLQLHLEQAPADAAARDDLATLYDERGEPDRAAALRRPDVHPPDRPPAAPAHPDPAPTDDAHARRDPTLPPHTSTHVAPARPGPADAALDEDASDRPRPPPDDDLPGADPTDADLLRFVDRFEGREGVHARMWHDPRRGTGYSPVHAPLTVDLLRAHLAGRLTLGSYVVRADQTVRFVVFDVDADRAALDAAHGDAARLAALRSAVVTTTDRLHRALRALDLDPLRVDSGYKGRHLWLLLPDPTPAAAALAFARAVLATTGSPPTGVHVDLFPRQAAVPPDGLGNLVKLPLGVHLRSGRRAVLLGDDDQPLADAWARLRAVRPAPLPVLPDPPAAAPSAAPPDDDLPPAPTNDRPPFTEAGFDTSPWLAPVLSGCAMLRALVDEALREGRLPAAGPVVLNHSLGHLPDGPDAVNYLYGRVRGVSDAARMGARHQGQPMGCRNVRSRLAELRASGVACDCVFRDRPGDYAHPLRHLDDHEPAPAPPTLDDLLADWTALQRRQRAVADEADALRPRVLRALAALPDRAWGVDGGTWRLTTTPDGDEVLTWHPDA